MLTVLRFILLLILPLIGTWFLWNPNLDIQVDNVLSGEKLTDKDTPGDSHVYHKEDKESAQSDDQPQQPETQQSNGWGVPSAAETDSSGGAPNSFGVGAGFSGGAPNSFGVGAGFSGGPQFNPVTGAPISGGPQFDPVTRAPMSQQPAPEPQKNKGSLQDKMTDVETVEVGNTMAIICFILTGVLALTTVFG